MKQVARLSFPGPSIAWVLAAAIAALLFALAGGAGRAAAAAADCRFVLGFKALHAMIPDTVGACLENEQHHPIEGFTLQRTTTGLLVWHKAVRLAAFTDGYRTWVSGPFGLPATTQYRAVPLGARRGERHLHRRCRQRNRSVYQGRQRRSSGLPPLAELGEQ